MDNSGREWTEWTSDCPFPSTYVHFRPLLSTQSIPVHFLLQTILLLGEKRVGQEIQNI